MKVQVLLLVLLLSTYVAADCTGLFSPYVPLPSSTFNYRLMETCCWYNDATCCGVHDEIFDLTVIAEQINNIAARGISEQCYIKLANFLCFWCNPTTADWLGRPYNGLNPTSTLLMCDDFCDELFIKCFDDLNSLVNYPTEIHSATQFCEDILLDNFYNDDEDIYPEVRITVVPNVGTGSCFGGVDDDDVEAKIDVCIPIQASSLVSDEEFNPIVYAPNSASRAVAFSSVLLIAAYLLLCTFL